MKCDNLTVVNLKGEETLKIDNEGNIYIKPNEFEIKTDIKLESVEISEAHINVIAEKVIEKIKLGGLI